MIKKHKFSTLTFIIAGILVYTGLHVGINTDIWFNGGGYSYLYNDNVNASSTFIVENAFNDAQQKKLSGYLQQANLHPSDSTEEKIIKLSKLILDRIDNTRGVPERSWYKKNTYEQFQMVWNKELSGGIFCTQFQLVYTTLANEAGIPTRVVHSTILRSPRSNKVKKGKGVSGHNFSESYIRETGQWAHVDINQKVILTRDVDGNFLNTVDLYDYYVGYKQGDNIVLTTYDSDTKIIQNKHFEFSKNFVNYLTERTAYRLFFQENQLFYYDRNGRKDYRFRPYLALNRVGMKSYAIAAIGVLLALVACIYLIWPFLARQYHHRFNKPEF